MPSEENSICACCGARVSHPLAHYIYAGYETRARYSCASARAPGTVYGLTWEEYRRLLRDESSLGRFDSLVGVTWP